MYSVQDIQGAKSETIGLDSWGEDANLIRIPLVMRVHLSQI